MNETFLMILLISIAHPNPPIKVALVIVFMLFECEKKQ